MKTFRFLIALLILNVSASLYAMSIYVQPLSFNAPQGSAAIKLNSLGTGIRNSAESPALKKINALLNEHQSRRLLSSYS